MMGVLKRQRRTAIAVIHAVTLQRHRAVHRLPPSPAPHGSLSGSVHAQPQAARRSRRLGRVRCPARDRQDAENRARALTSGPPEWSASASESGQRSCTTRRPLTLLLAKSANRNSQAHRCCSRQAPRVARQARRRLLGLTQQPSFPEQTPGATCAHRHVR